MTDGAVYDWRLSHRDVIDKMWIKHCIVTKAPATEKKAQFVKRLTLQDVFSFMTVPEQKHL